jgi:hypothetical protein
VEKVAAERETSISAVIGDLVREARARAERAARR